MPKHCAFPPDPNKPKPLPGSKKRFPAKLTTSERKSSYRARLDANMDETVRKQIFSRYRNAIEKEKCAADEKVWHIDGMLMNRYELMEYISIMVAEGLDKVKLTKQEGWPTLSQVEAWYKRHPDFRVAMDNAERLRGAILGESAVDEVMSAEPHTAGLAKIRAETLGKAAARMNSKYQDKQVIETTDISELMNRDQIEDKIRSLHERYPALKKLGMKMETGEVTGEVGGVVDVETESQNGEK